MKSQTTAEEDSVSIRIMVGLGLPNWLWLKNELYCFKEGACWTQDNTALKTRFGYRCYTTNYLKN